MTRLTAVLVLLVLSGCKVCIRSHKELTHHAGYTQFIWTGDVVVPFYHPAHESWDEVCEEYK